ncbi:hypothetical protein [Pseudoduganella buxea]|uniref:Uncharacterized protein n=1 Tax=Pseudoduganella buxea TaxID=1949069 RepID=A0A6I3T5N9_9BURK|nr:hypothetical protein [Pseudoduganella buxea]MTV56235.1 hypothetical protein [Pseudoduganella buxea]GGC04215.1 hypothetical protein GCM10011572_27690 [Pseudoduganella buxea]
MSVAFDKFMEQYKSIGSQKADGYTLDMLIGLEDAEKLEIFRLLQTELPWSAQWLFFVNPEKATVIARELEAKWRGDPYRRVDWLQKELIKHTGDMIFQDHMMEDYAHYIDKLRPAVVDSIGSTPTTEAKLKFLEEVILVEVVDYAVMAAIRNLLFQ